MSFALFIEYSPLLTVLCQPLKTGYIRFANKIEKELRFMRRDRRRVPGGAEWGAAG